MKFTMWMLEKISSTLSNNGCKIVKQYDTSEYATLLIRDSFGYFHEIRLKTISRIEGYNLDESAYEDIDSVYNQAKTGNKA